MALLWWGGVEGGWEEKLGWLAVAAAEVELLVAVPAEVLGAYVAKVGARRLSVDGVCRVALWAADALALR